MTNPDKQPTTHYRNEDSSDPSSRQKLPNEGPHEGLLTEVLAATLNGDGDALTDSEWGAIEQVARAHPPGTEIDLGVATKLVSAFLATRFPSLVNEKAVLSRMSLRVAGSFWSHPIAQQRLIRFWELISGHVRS